MLADKTSSGWNFSGFPVGEANKQHCVRHLDGLCWLWRALVSWPRAGQRPDKGWTKKDMIYAGSWRDINCSPGELFRRAKLSLKPREAGQNG